MISEAYISWPKIVRGADWDISMTATAGDEAIPFTTYSAFEFTIKDVVTVSLGNGLGVDDTGLISLALTPEQTALGLLNTPYDCYLKWVDDHGKTRYPLGGTVLFVDP